MSTKQEKPERKQPPRGRLDAVVGRVLRIFSKTTSRAQREKDNFWEGLSLSEIIIECLEVKYPDYGDHMPYLLQEIEKVKEYHLSLTEIDFELGRFKKAYNAVSKAVWTS